MTKDVRHDHFVGTLCGLRDTRAKDQDFLGVVIQRVVGTLGVVEHDHDQLSAGDSCRLDVIPEDLTNLVLGRVPQKHGVEEKVRVFGFVSTVAGEILDDDTKSSVGDGLTGPVFHQYPPRNQAMGPA